MVNFSTFYCKVQTEEEARCTRRRAFLFMMSDWRGSARRGAGSRGGDLPLVLVRGCRTFTPKTAATTFVKAVFT